MQATAHNNASDSIHDLCQTAHARAQKEYAQLAEAYSGEALPQEAWSIVRADSRAVLVDVRTPEEWAEGVPDGSSAQGRVIAISWKTNPGYVLNPHFAEAFAAQKIDRDAPIFFICKGGGRSLDAALAMRAQGYRHCFNVTSGYEGQSGWKASGLPCGVLPQATDAK